MLYYRLKNLINVTIHDELVLALTHPDENGKVPLYKIVKSSDISVKLEELAYRHLPNAGEWKKMVPDIIVTISPKAHPESQRKVVIELESDVKWDFAASLRQIKDYKQFLPLRQKQKYEVIAIIPKEYERYVPKYNDEGIDVWLWEAKAEWICERCGNKAITKMERTKILRKCEHEKCNFPDHHLKRLVNVSYEPTQDESLSVYISSTPS